MTNPTAYQQQHLRSLTGMRFFAALSVFVAHVGVHWPAYKLGDLPFGAAGVSFFYVLSGFILTYVYGSRLDVESNSNEASLDRNTKTPFSFKRFYLRRFARIWPLHIATLLLTLFFVMGTQAFFNRPNAIGKIAINSLLLQSWIPNYDWIYSLNGPSWSLAVEAFFYVVFPFLLLGGAKRFIGKYILITIGTMIGLLAINHFAPRSDSWIQMNSIIHANPLMRLFEFATGIGCGFLFLRNSSTVGRSSSFGKDSTVEILVLTALLGFFATANLIGMYSPEMQNRLPLAIWYWFRFCGAAPVFAIVVYVFASSKGLVSNLLSNRIMIYLGEISYSFYMVHMGVMLILKRMEWLNGAWVEAGVVASCFCLSLILSSILYQLIELPFRRSIVDCAEGTRTQSALIPWRQSLTGWIRTPCLIPLVLLAIGSGWFISANQFDTRSSTRIADIVSSTPLELRTVNFENDAVLLGVTSKPTEQGDLILELVWVLKPNRREDRFIKLLDANQQVIGRGSANRGLFNSVSDEETVVDRVTIDASKMNNVETIAVGFFDKTRKSAKVDRGPRSARGRQLHVWTKKSSPE